MLILHEEYKVPHGKLLVLDLEVEVGHLSKVRISGDFFIHPPESLDCINNVLTGLSVNVGQIEIMNKITLAIPSGTEMLGFQPLDIAKLICKALS